MTKPNIKQQVSWLESEVGSMRRAFAAGKILRETITREQSQAKLAAAEACLATMKTMLDVCFGKEVANG